MKTYNVHVYMLYLLQFQDGRVVFDEAESKARKNKVEQAIHPHPEARHSINAGFDTFVLSAKHLTNLIEKDLSEKDTRRGSTGKDSMSDRSMSIVNAVLGYYHHRFIFHVELAISNMDIHGAIRSFREPLQQYSNEIVRKYRNLIRECPELSKKGQIASFYEYQLIVVEKSADILKSKEMPFSFETTSLCFDMIKPTFWWEKKMLVRISLPCTIVYGNIQVNKDKALIRDFINAIYQCALYGKKNRLSEMEKICPSGKIDVDDLYKLDEQDLQNLWTFMIDTMGGKTANLSSFRIMRLTLIVAALAIVSTLVTIFVPFISEFFK